MKQGMSSLERSDMDLYLTKLIAKIICYCLMGVVVWYFASTLLKK